MPVCTLDPPLPVEPLPVDAAAARVVEAAKILEVATRVGGRFADSLADLCAAVDALDAAERAAAEAESHESGFVP